MAAYCLAGGRLHRADGADTPPDRVQIYHLTPAGELTRPDTAPEPAPGEGLLLCTPGFYVEPVEIQVDFLKAADAASWLERLAVRHLDRARYLDEALWVLAQIREEEP